MTENTKEKPTYEPPAILELGQLAKGRGQDMGVCNSGSSAASGCFNGTLASTMMSGTCGTGITIV